MFKKYLNIMKIIKQKAMISNLLDIKFFVGVLINLLLIALICYYFKRKIDNLEYSQSERKDIICGQYNRICR